MSERRGDFMLTASGRRFWPLDPRADEVDVSDIAQALGNQGRYNGHTRHFYSVAQHCVELARWFIKQGQVEHARWACVHDAAEAYTGDTIRPLKPHLPAFVAIERAVERTVFGASRRASASGCRASLTTTRSSPTAANLPLTALATRRWAIPWQCR